MERHISWRDLGETSDKLNENVLFHKLENDVGNKIVSQILLQQTFRKIALEFILHAPSGGHLGIKKDPI